MDPEVVGGDGRLVLRSEPHRLRFLQGRQGRCVLSLSLEIEGEQHQPMTEVDTADLRLAAPVGTGLPEQALGLEQSIDRMQRVRQPEGHVDHRLVRGSEGRVKVREGRGVELDRLGRPPTLASERGQVHLRLGGLQAHALRLRGEVVGQFEARLGNRIELALDGRPGHLVEEASGQATPQGVAEVGRVVLAQEVLGALVVPRFPQARDRGEVPLQAAPHDFEVGLLPSLGHELHEVGREVLGQRCAQLLQVGDAGLGPQDFGLPVTRL